MATRTAGAAVAGGVMSGGSLDYAYSRVESAVSEIAQRATCLEHKAFAKHLFLVARALHDVEWVFSCDFGPGDDLPAIRKVLGGNHASVTRQVAIDEVRRILAELEGAQ